MSNTSPDKRGRYPGDGIDPSEREQFREALFAYLVGCGFDKNIAWSIATAFVEAASEEGLRSATFTLENGGVRVTLKLEWPPPQQ